MKKLTVCALVFTVFFVFSASTAFPWGSLTHVFIGQHLKKQSGPFNLDEIYGTTAPDIFNYIFSPPYIYYRDYLHYKTHFDFMRVWDAVKYGYEKPVAYGFVAHNNDWGADWTAHVNSLTLLPDEGYIITKTKALHDILMAVPEYAALDWPYEVSIEVIHHIVEAAGDVIVNKASPGIAKKLIKSTLRPSPVFQNLLVKAYAQGLADFSTQTPFPLDDQSAAQVIRGSEVSFRAYMVTYGTVFQQDEPHIIQGIVLNFEAIAMAYLGAFGITLPPEVNLKPLIELALYQAIDLCEDDYMAEIWATIDYVDQEMKAHKIN